MAKCHLNDLLKFLCVRTVVMISLYIKKFLSLYVFVICYKYTEVFLTTKYFLTFLFCLFINTFTNIKSIFKPPKLFYQKCIQVFTIVQINISINTIDTTFICILPYMPIIKLIRNLRCSSFSIICYP